MIELERDRKTSPCCRKGWLWHQMCGMRLVREITPPKPQKVYRVYDVKCEACGEPYAIRK